MECLMWMVLLSQLLELKQKDYFAMKMIWVKQMKKLLMYVNLRIL